MSIDLAFGFLRKVPILDVVLLVGAWLAMWRWWQRAGVAGPAENNPDIRVAGATAITNQINGALTAGSIMLAGVGAVLVIGLDKKFPPATLEHLMVAAGAALFSVPFGVYTLGYIPSVLHTFDVSRKAAVELACFFQLNLIVVACVRFALALWHLTGNRPQ